MGTAPRRLKKADVAEIMVSYSKMNDSVFWASHDKGYPYSIFVPHEKLINGCTYEKELLHSNEGDSIIYIVPADSVFKDVLHLPLPYFLHHGDMMKVHVKIAAIMDSVRYTARIKQVKIYKKDMDIQEQLSLLRYATANGITDSMKHDNVYIVPEIQGNGPVVKKGELISLAYSGAFLNGKVFDSVSANAPMQFRLGDTAQTIEGLEIALKMMRVGEKAKIIIPSQLAFGNNGSSTGIVPPYTTVVYEVTLLKVKAL